MALICVVATVKINAQQTIQLQPFLSGLGSVLFVTNAKDGSNRIFVVEQGGTIKVVQPGSTTPTVFINLAGKLTSGGERGLLGLTFHPQFAVNRKFYVNYTCSTANNPACVTTGDTIISEFTLLPNDPNQGDPASERVLLKIPQPYSNHNGGMVEFGPDGYLYIGMGDGGSGNDPENRAQNRSLLLGKMLRIDVTPSGSNAYTIPPTNPFTGANTTRCDNGSTTAGNTCQEIYTIGMRNPFRWSFDRQTGQLFAGDVGQGAIEEIDIIQSGKNYGWRVYEGTQCTNLDPALCASGATPITQEPPIYQYTHAASRCSISGGYVYRGRRGTLPLGAYVYGDYCTGEIWMLQNNGGTWNSTLLLDTTRNIPAFGEDEAGEIYVCGIGSGTVEKIGNPNAVIPRNVVADFDGDLKTDVSVFRPSNGFWYFLNSSNNSFSTVQFGTNGDKPAPGDYDGDGKTDVAVYRPSTGTWYVLNSSNNVFRAISFGVSTDVPVAGDYDGDGKTDVAVYRGSNSTWYFLNSSNNAFRAISFGVSTDVPVAGDYDGDGKTDVAVLRPSSNTWYVLQSGNNGLFVAQWGTAGDIPVVGDYNGDGRADVAVWRPSNGTWYALQSGSNTLYSKPWGVSGDVPQPGDYDGDGKTDAAVTRNAAGNKVWYVSRSSNNTNQITQFGFATDTGIPATDVP